MRKIIVILFLVLFSILVLFATIPMVDKTPETMNPVDSPVDISDDLHSTLTTVQTTEKPITLTTKKEGEIKEKIYINPETGIKQKIRYNGEITIYKIRENSRLTIYEYKYSQPVYIKQQTKHVVNSSEDIAPVDFARNISETSEKFDLKTAAKLDNNNYIVKDENSIQAKYTIKNGKVTKFEYKDTTYLIEFNSNEKIEKPEDPQPNTDGEEEEIG